MERLEDIYQGRVIVDSSYLQSRRLEEEAKNRLRERHSKDYESSRVPFVSAGACGMCEDSDYEN